MLIQKLPRQGLLLLHADSGSYGISDFGWLFDFIVLLLGGNKFLRSYKCRIFR
jgi:hypothetical protein